MSYTQTNWVDGETPVNARNLNKLENGVAELHAALENGELRGDPGADGISPTVSVSKSGKVTTVSITDKNGTKTATINDGADGGTGKDGASITVESVSESGADGGSNVVTFSDGNTLTIKNGSKGSTGSRGATGATGATGSAGKSAYQYAQDGGYTGTESEFAEKLANGFSGRTVKDYGAKGNGSTDDTTAFQNALAENRVVKVPGGTYKLSGTLVIKENCSLELSQDTVLQFANTSGNCIEMRSSAVLRGNHGMISVPYAFTGNVISMDTTKDGTNHNSIPPYLAAGSHMAKRQRFVYDINILKPDSNGICKSTDGKCNGTAIYMSAEGTASFRWMWVITMTGIRIAGGFSYGIRAANFDKAGDYADNAWNHDMRIEAAIENCEIGVSLENCNGAHLAVTIQPHATESGVKYAKHGIYLNDSRFVDTIGSRVWDWNENGTLWTSGGRYQHIAMIGNCRGFVLDDFLCSESSTDIRDLIYTDTPANFDTMAVIQEAGGKGVSVHEDYIKYFTDVLATATDGNGNVFQGKGYVTSGYNINSDGSMAANQYYGCTGFIPVKPKDTVYVHGIVLGAGDGSSNFSLYNSTFAKVANINSANSQFQAGNNYYYHYTALDNGFKVVVAPNNDPTATAYLRFSYLTNMVKDTPMVAVNEEIRYIQANFLADDIKVKVDNVLGGTVSGGGGGADGFSPIANVKAVTGGAEITITDKSGTTKATVYHGQDGAKGDKGDSIKGDTGSPGADGFSPTVAVSKSGKVTTVSITDKNGTKTATINDGSDGASGSNGKDGTSVTVKSVSESTADGGSNVVTFSDGKTVTIKNGSKGSKGDKGDSVKGDTGATGKTAYQYAVDGGYTGTEAQFAAKLAEENAKTLYVNVTVDENKNATSDMSYAEILSAYEKGFGLVGIITVNGAYGTLTAPVLPENEAFVISGAGIDQMIHSAIIVADGVFYDSIPIVSDNPGSSEPVEVATPDWFANDGEAGYIKNKPEGVGYIEYEQGTALANNITVNNGSVSGWLNYTMLNGAKKVRVIFDGATYDFPVEYGHDDFDGNYFRIGGEAYPFTILGYENNGSTYMSCASGSHTASFYLLTEGKVHKIDSKFLPDDESDDVAWREIANTEMTSTYDASFGVFAIPVCWDIPMALEPVPKEWSVTYDGVPYERMQTTPAPGIGNLIGNLYFVNDMLGTSFPNTGEPFLAVVLGKRMYLMTLDTAPTMHTIKISTYCKPFTALPVVDLTKYIEDCHEYTEISGDFTEVYNKLSQHDTVLLKLKWSVVGEGSFTGVQAAVAHPIHTEFDEVYVRCFVFDQTKLGVFVFTMDLTKDTLTSNTREMHYM